MKLLFFLYLLSLTFSNTQSKSNLNQYKIKLASKLSSTLIGISCLFYDMNPSFADMLTFPLPAPLKNNIVLIRAGECFADARHETQTNAAKKLRQDNALTAHGREQIIEAGKYLESIGFQPSYIWVSNTERAYESAVVLAREIQLGKVNFAYTMLHIYKLISISFIYIRIYACLHIHVGQNRIVPEFSFLDARAVGTYEGKNDELTWSEIHKNDETIGIL